MKKKSEILQKYILMGMLFSIGILHSQTPNWSVNSANYSLDASIISVLKIDDKISTDINDVVGVFDENDIVRGVAKVSFNVALNKHLVFITVLSNTNGDALKFKIYDASENKVIESTNTTLNFTPNDVLGSADIPYEIKGNKVLNITDFENNNLSFYPNPTKNNLFITGNSTIKLVKVYNLLGTEIINIKPNKTKIKIQLGNLKKGIYLIKTFAYNNQNSTKKIIKL